MAAFHNVKDSPSNRVSQGSTITFLEGDVSTAPATQAFIPSAIAADVQRSASSKVFVKIANPVP